MDMPTEMELRNREYEVKFKKQLAEEQQEELAKTLSLIDGRIESLEEVDKQEGDNKDQMKQMAEKLADLEEKPEFVAGATSCPTQMSYLRLWSLFCLLALVSGCQSLPMAPVVSAQPKAVIPMVTPAYRGRAY